jgi:hypothetical protein
MLAKYLSHALVRKRLNIVGNGGWEDYLSLTFVPPIPGEPKSRIQKRLYYRTLPENITSNHMPPWRARGFLSIDGDSARPRLASWNEKREYVNNTVTLVNGSGSVTIQADYEITS